MLGLAACLTFAQSAQAQVTQSLALGGTYEGFSGYTLNGITYGGGGPIGPSSLAGAALAYVYCIDIPDEVTPGGTYANNTTTTNGSAVYNNAALGNTWAVGNTLVAVPNANGIAGLLATYGNVVSTDVQKDALQAAIWVQVYDGGTYTGSGPFIVTDTTVLAQMQIYLAGAGSGIANNFLWLSPNGVNNAAAQALVAAYATPEPSTFAIAGLGALGFLGYGWKRRKRS
jgi:hypothetical protein